MMWDSGDTGKMRLVHGVADECGAHVEVRVVRAVTADASWNSQMPCLQGLSDDRTRLSRMCLHVAGLGIGAEPLWRARACPHLVADHVTRAIHYGKIHSGYALEDADVHHLSSRCDVRPESPALS